VKGQSRLVIAGSLRKLFR